MAGAIGCQASLQTVQLPTDEAGNELCLWPSNLTPSARQTWIVCTLGPASWRKPEELLEAGMGIVRLNCSHRQVGAMEEAVPRLRKLSATTGRPLLIMGDLQGPKFRLGRLSHGEVTLQDGCDVALVLADDESDLSTANRVTLLRTDEQVALIAALKPGQEVLLSDGKVSLTVTSCLPEGSGVRCRVLAGGVLHSRAGVNVPGLHLPVSALTTKDRADAADLVALGVDFLALSFVQKASDVIELRELIESVRSKLASSSATPLPAAPKVIAKIEKTSALEEIDEILQHVDGVMVARGDMAPEVGFWRVPLAQKILVRKAARAGKLAIVATQMLLSMVDHPVPTRAEATDVFNAVLDGCDATMLSEESASGAHPLAAVTTMAMLLAEAERLLPTAEISRKRATNEFLQAISEEAIRSSGCLSNLVATPSSSSAQPVPSGPPPRRVYVLLSGKRATGKDFLASTAAAVFERSRGLRRHGRCVVRRLANVVKLRFAEARGLEFSRLSSQAPEDRAYKELHREELTAFFADYVAQFPTGEARIEHLANELLFSVDEGARFGADEQGVACVIISDVRHPAEVAWFREPSRGLHTVCVRIEASDEARRRRGWVPEPTKDNDATETGLDGFLAWDYVFHNDEDGEAPARRFVSGDLLPRVATQLV